MRTPTENHGPIPDTGAPREGALAGRGRGRWRWRTLSRAIVVLGVAGVTLLGGPVAVAEVELNLRIPEVETHVLGDAIPLYWRFTNRSGEALGFMWEGCCRLNGKLEVRAADRALATVPPGQALAHMFAKADRLEPGVAKEYDTRVGDWVRLPGTGTYELQGLYRGVLPSQVPQVARGLSLWRDAARSASVRLSVLGVADYLAQREDRARRRGLRLALSGTERLTPLQPARFRVVFENPSGTAQTFAWPEDASLWVLDGRNERVAPAAVVSGDPEPAPVTVPAGGRVERAFAIGPERFEGEPFGDYTVFVDLASPGAGRPRVPSTALGLVWRWDAREVRDLVVSAAKGAGTGARNAPLKMLRVYLAEVGPALGRLAGEPGLEAGAADLAGRLAFASRLKVLRPQPGSVDLALALGGDGGLRWVDPEVAGLGRAGADVTGVVAELGGIVGVRRHLGWEIAVVLEPGSGVTAGRVFEAAERFAAWLPDLAGPVSVRVAAAGGTSAPAPAPAPASAVTMAPALARLELNPGGSPRWGGGPGIRWTSEGVDVSPDGRAWGRVTEGAGLEAWLERAGSGLRLEVGSGVIWERVVAGLRPVLKPGVRVGVWRAAGGP